MRIEWVSESGGSRNPYNDPLTAPLCPTIIVDDALYPCCVQQLVSLSPLERRNRRENVREISLSISIIGVYTRSFLPNYFNRIIDAVFYNKIMIIEEIKIFKIIFFL